jgi:HEAT repeat protein
MQLWKIDQHNPHKQITIATYEKQGRATHILKNYFVERVQQLSSNDKKLASAAFNYLVNKHGTKMAYPLGDLAKQLRVDETTLAQTLDKLEQARILRRQKRENVLWYELYHDIFSKSIYDWNERYKIWQRIKKFATDTGTVFASVFLLFLGNDWWMNHTTYHLRLSLKAGSSGTIEVYQGKKGSSDIFGQQKFIREVNYTRANIEADKLFQQKSIEKNEQLNQELIREFPLAKRFKADWENGEIEKVLCFANQYIGGHNMGLSLQTSDKLAGFRSIESINRLKELLRTTQNKELKAKIIEGLGNSHAPRQLQLTNFLLPFTTDDDPDVRKSVADALAKLGTVETIPSLIELLKDTDWTVYLSAANGLTQLEAREAVPLLIKLLKSDEDEMVRYIAANGLAQLGAREAIPQLIELLKDPDSDIRRVAADGLAQLGAHEAVQPLIELLKDPDSGIRRVAADGLAQLGAREAVLPLIELLKAADKYVHRYAAYVLAQLGAVEARDVVQPLIELLLNGDFDVRRHAAIVLGQLGAHEAISPLIKLLKNTDSDVRNRAAKGLAQLGLLEAVPPLIELLKGDYYVRGNAADVLGQLGAREVVQPLIQLLKDTNWEVRRSAADGLIQLGAREAIQPLMALLKDKNIDWKVRRRVADVLTQLGAHEAVKPLIEWLKDNDSNIRRNAAAGLGKLGMLEAVQPLIKSLKDTDLQVRSSAAVSLGQLGAREAVPPLMALLKDKNGPVSKSAVKGLAQLGAREAIPPLIALFKNKDINWKIRRRAADVLAQLGAREAVQPLIELFKNTDSDVRRRAVAVWLGQFGSREAVKPLIKLLKNTNWKIRTSAAKGLGQLEAREAVKPLIQLLKDTNWKVRHSAANGLAQLGAREVVKPLIQLLKDTDWKVRNSAAKGLGQLGAREAIQPLKVLLKEGNKDVRWSAISALTQLGVHEFEQLNKELTTLEKQSHHQSAYQRQKSAEKIGQLFIKQSVKLLTPLLKDKYLGVKKQAIISLGQIGEQQADWLRPVLPQMRPLLEEANIHIRRETIIALGKMVSQLSEEKTQWLETFANLAKNQEEILGIRLVALKALAKLGTAAELILELLQPEMLEQESDSFILTAFTALGDIRNPVALDFLHEQLAALTERKRVWRKQRDADKLTQTQDDVASNVGDEENRWLQSQWETDLGYAIAQIDPESSGIALLKHELAQVRKGAWLAIGKVGKVNIINELVTQRRESEPEQAHFRHAAYQAIDNALMTIEMQGNSQDLLYLKKLFKTVKQAGIKDRMNWTILSLKQRINE